jgi:hypothetical protein
MCFEIVSRGAVSSSSPVTKFGLGPDWRQWNSARVDEFVQFGLTVTGRCCFLGNVQVASHPAFLHIPLISVQPDASWLALTSHPSKYIVCKKENTNQFRGTRSISF